MAEDESGWQLPLAALCLPLNTQGNAQSAHRAYALRLSATHCGGREHRQPDLRRLREVVGESVTPAENFFEAGATR